MVPPPQSRRRFLQVVGAGGIAGLAGCTGSAVEESTTQTTDQTETTTGSDTQTDPATSMSTVFHLTADAEAKQEHALRNVANLLGDDSVDTDQVVLVANGQGITAFIASSSLKDQATSLMDEDVSIRVCENSMNAFDLSKSDFIDGIETVPAGVGELTRLQAGKGFAYIRVP